MRAGAQLWSRGSSGVSVQKRLWSRGLQAPLWSCRSRPVLRNLWLRAPPRSRGRRPQRAPLWSCRSRPVLRNPRLSAPPRSQCRRGCGVGDTGIMVSTIKVGMGSSKSTYLRNHTFRSPLAPTKARPCCNLAPKLRDHCGYALTFEQLHLPTFQSIQMTGE